MLKLTAIFYIIIAPTLAGIFSLVPLSMSGTLDFDPMILIAFLAVGAILALPVSWYVAKRLDSAMSSKGPKATA